MVLPVTRACNSCPICATSVLALDVCLLAVMPCRTAASSFSFCLAKPYTPSSTVPSVTYGSRIRDIFADLSIHQRFCCTTLALAAMLLMLAAMLLPLMIAMMCVLGLGS